MTRAKRICIAAIALFLVSTASNLSAYLVEDPTPALTWDDMPKCALVVEAVYDSSAGKTLSIKVVRVFKGDGAKPGDILTVDIGGWYSVSAGRSGYKINGVVNGQTVLGEKIVIPPQLCRESGYMMGGQSTPGPVIDDIGKPTVYFFPSKDKLSLARNNQAQDGRFADDWDNLVTGKPMDVYFRITQQLNSDVSRAALEELRRTRDPKTIDRLLAWTSGGEGAKDYGQTADRFEVIGDKNGDVFDPLLKLFDSAKTIPWIRWEIARSMARVDSKRAGEALIKRATDGPWQDAAATELRWVTTDDSLNFLLDRLAAGDRPAIMLSSLESILHSCENTSITTPDLSAAELSRLRELAKPLLKALLSSDTLDRKTRTEIDARFHYLWPAP